MKGQPIHTRRTELLSILTRLELVISEDRQDRRESPNLTTAATHIKEELGLVGKSAHCPSNSTLVDE